MSLQISDTLRFYDDDGISDSPETPDQLNSLAFASRFFCLSCCGKEQHARRKTDAVYYLRFEDENADRSFVNAIMEDPIMSAR